MSEADLCRSLERIPPTMLDINRQKCRLCDKEMKKTSDFRKHILSHAQIPQFRCRFCKQGSIFTAQKREQMFQVWFYKKKRSIFTLKIIFQHIRSCHEKVMTNGETEKSVLEKCRVNPKVLWDAYGITCDWIYLNTFVPNHRYIDEIIDISLISDFLPLIKLCPNEASES